tara:strand:+ start:616 stop:1035 length:420 start_codon:yes stop_codon:yes gene_type:complete
MSRDGNMHPNSLKNLRPFTKEGAREGQKNSVLSRKANKEAREALKVSIADWKDLKDDLSEETPSALDVLRIAMVKAISVEDMEEATRLASILAEFEAPKLQRQDINQVTKTSDLTDEELEQAIQEMSTSGFSVNKSSLN